MQRRNTQVYIVRLWKETNSKQPWRGKIQNIRSGQSIAVSDLDQLEQLIRRCLLESQENKQKRATGLR